MPTKAKIAASVFGFFIDVGIREGTFVAVLLVSTFIRCYQKPFRFFKRRLVKA